VQRIVAGVVALVSFIAYAGFAARDVVFGDGGELTLAAVTNGVAHPPGYPLWVMLAHAFTMVPVGTLPFRVSLFAAAMHALALALIFLCAYKLTKQYLPALAATVLAGITPLFVTWSLQPEVFSLNDAIVAGLVLALVSWIENPSNVRRAIPVGALFGLGLANQQTIVLMAPVLLFAAIRARAALLQAPLTLALASAACLVGATLPYLHTLVVSHHALAWQFGRASNLQELLSVVLRRTYGSGSLVNGTMQGGSVITRFAAMCAPIAVVLVLSMVGSCVLYRQKKAPVASIVPLAFVCTLVGFCAIANVDASQPFTHVLLTRFSLMPLVAVAPFAACAIPRNVAPFALGVLVLLGIVELPSASLASFHDARTLARDELASLPDGAVGFVKGDTLTTTLPYFRIVEGWRPDVLLVYPDLFPGVWYQNVLAKQMHLPPDGRPTILGLVADNPQLHFYGIGDPDVQGMLNAPGHVVAYTRGLASWITVRPATIPLRSWYAGELALITAPGFGALRSADARTNPFIANARSYYATAYLNAARDAQALGNVAAARYWLILAQRQVPDSPVIRDAATSLRQSM
jgi:hypothetical protein